MGDLEHRLQDRLDELRRELAVGEDRLRVLERETQAVHQTVLRISGAIQVLTELQDREQNPDKLGHPEPQSA